MTKRMSKPVGCAGLLIVACCLMSMPTAFADENSGQIGAKIQAQSNQIDQLSSQADKILQDQQQIATELEQIRYWVR